MRHLEPPGYAKAIAGIRLDEVDMRQRTGKFVHCVQVFALGNGNPGRLADLGKSFEIIRDDRLFEPRDIIRLDLVSWSNWRRP